MTTAYPGRGSQLLSSPDGATFTKVGQLQQVIPTGQKSSIVDQTNLSSPGKFRQVLASLVDGGDIVFTWIADPQNPTIAALGTYQRRLQLTWFKLILTDGTQTLFQAYVSEFTPLPRIDYAKVLTFTGKLTLSGPVQFGSAGFQFPGFQSPGFQTAFE